MMTSPTSSTLSIRGRTLRLLLVVGAAALWSVCMLLVVWVWRDNVVFFAFGDGDNPVAAMKATFLVFSALHIGLLILLASSFLLRPSPWVWTILRLALLAAGALLLLPGLTYAGFAWTGRCVAADTSGTFRCSSYTSTFEVVPVCEEYIFRAKNFR